MSKPIRPRDIFSSRMEDLSYQYQKSDPPILHPRCTDVDLTLNSFFIKQDQEDRKYILKYREEPLRTIEAGSPIIVYQLRSLADSTSDLRPSILFLEIDQKGDIIEVNCDKTFNLSPSLDVLPLLTDEQKKEVLIQCL